MFPLSDLARLKQSGGLNNDWDLSCRVIELLVTLLELSPASPEGGDAHPRDPWERHRETMGRCDLEPLIRHLGGSRQPLSDLVVPGSRSENPFVRSLFRGEVGSGNLIKQIFQEVYLGPELFRRSYSSPPRMHSGPGYIEREGLLPPRKLLEALAREHLLAVATGRPGGEAQHFLSRFGLSGVFRRVVTLDDCLREQERLLAAEGTRACLSKPHPYMLDRIARELEGEGAGEGAERGERPRPGQRFYVGDLPDDVEAAHRSGYEFVAIGLLQAAPDREALRADLQRAGADHIAEDFPALVRLLSPA